MMFGMKKEKGVKTGTEKVEKEGHEGHINGQQQDLDRKKVQKVL